MSPLEIAWGYVPGHVGPPLPAGDDSRRSPRQVLEDVVREALHRPPCGVAFSGGRDSSAILAIAVHVARRDGLPDPVAITKVFPGAPGTAEDEWQEAVVRHLDVREWHRMTIGDELDLVGPVATSNLLRHGVIWPPTVHSDTPMLDQLRGGSLIDGEGGDEVLGVAAHRIGPVTQLLRSRRRIRRRHVRAALAVLAPSAVRARRLRGQLGAAESLTWLRPAGREALIEALTDAVTAQPLSFATSVRMVPQRRSQALLARNRRLLARPYDVAVSSPLLDPRVVEALARAGGVLGPGDRTRVLRALLPDLLPDTVLARTSKALFNEAYMARHTAEFVAHWDGTGLDLELVDPEELSRLWRTEERNALTAALLQSAWLAGHGRPGPSSDRHC